MALNDYKVIGDKLGQGGFGQTYLVQAIKLPGKPKKVLKRFFPNQEFTPEGLKIFRRLFKKEADMLGKLGHHPQIPTLQEYIVEAGEFCLIQEYIEGKSLLEDLKGGVKLSEQRVLSLLEEILEVLKFIHEQDAIHLDLKPENMIRRKLDGKIVVIDFGGAKQTSALQVKPDGKTVQTVTVGTKGYTPNEQLQGKPRPASDVYAVGKIAIQALTGRPPYKIPEDDHTGELLWRGLASDVSPDFTRVINKMISYHFKDRYKNAAEALKVIRELRAKNQPVQLTPNFNFDPNSAFSPPIFGKPNFPSPPTLNNPVVQTPKKNVGKLEKKSVSEVVFTSWSFWYVALIYTSVALVQVMFGAPFLILATWLLSGVAALPFHLKSEDSTKPLPISGLPLLISYLIVGLWIAILITSSRNSTIWQPGTVMVALMGIFMIGAVGATHEKLIDIQADEDEIFSLGLLIGVFIILGGVLAHIPLVMEG